MPTSRTSWTIPIVALLVLASMGWGALPWPGVGYPSTHFWKEEGVVGNGYITVMLDTNGTLYDVYYPGAGARNGVAAANEGYYDGGQQQHPWWLGSGDRGQMHVEMGTLGLRVNGGTMYWCTNQSGGNFTGHTQQYVADTNVIQTSYSLSAAGDPLAITMFDFCPAGIAWPETAGGDPLRGIYIKRVLIANQSASARTVDVFFNANFDLNGAASYDAMYYDAATDAIVAYDNTFRNTSTSGEWNPRSFGSGYDKNVSLYLGVTGKVCTAVGSAGGTGSAGNWREAGSSDNDQGWIGWTLGMAPGEQKELDVAVIGAFEEPAGQTGTWNYWGAPAATWFKNTSMQVVQTTTQAYWSDWLASGTTMDCPDETYDALFARGLLASALHIDGAQGAIIAGMHNGAYPYVWPRDCVYAAVSLDRTGHWAEAEAVYDWLREVAYVETSESWGRAFFYQKYTTDGHHIWNSPQVDETANVPWGVYYHYLCEGDGAFLSTNWTMVRDAAYASSSDSAVDSRLYYDDGFALMHSNNVWEDDWDLFLYSNATVVKGLEDAAVIATALGQGGEASTFSGRAAAIRGGIDARVAWGGENVDISQLGLAYPFGVYAASDPRMLDLRDEMLVAAAPGGTPGDGGLDEPGDETVWRYVDDSYWGGGPWWLSTLWMGLYEAQLQDAYAGTTYVDLHKVRIDDTIATRGPLGFGAEQVAPSFALLYPGFELQTAWPNVWESMATLVDAFMAFLDFSPNAPAGSFRVEPMLPAGWPTMTFHNLRVGASRVDATVADNGHAVSATFTHTSGGTMDYSVVLRVPDGETLDTVRVDGASSAYAYDAATGRVTVSGTLNPATGGSTVVEAVYNPLGVATWELF